PPRSFPQSVPGLPRRPHKRSLGTWVIIGVPALLALLFVWQVGSNLVHTDLVVRSAVSISRVSLEADPLGSRIDLVLVDRVGQETTLTGTVAIQLREPNGTVWQTTRAVTPDDFVPLTTGGLLAGRVGYAVVIPATD